MQLERHIGWQEIDLVQRYYNRQAASADLFQYLLDGLDLAMDVGMRGIADVDQQIGLGDLLQRSAESGDQDRGEPLHKADGIGEQDFLSARQPYAPRRGIERREQPVLRLAVQTVGEPVEQRRLASIGVADQRYDGRTSVRASIAVALALLAHQFQILLQMIPLPTQHAAVDLDLLLTFAALLRAAALPREVRPLPRNAGQIVLDLGQFHLQATFAGTRALAEDDQGLLLICRIEMAHDVASSLQSTAPDHLLEMTHRMDLFQKLNLLV